MTASAMNHFTILTADVDATLAFYSEFLGLRSGPRPPFTFPGAWLYAEGGNNPNGAKVEIDFDAAERGPA